MQDIRMDDRLTRPLPTADPLRRQGDGDGPGIYNRTVV